VTQLQPITVVFNVAEDNLAQVRRKFSAALPCRRRLRRSQMNKIATGHLLTIDNQVDTTTGTIRFRGSSRIATRPLSQPVRERPACW